MRWRLLTVSVAAMLGAAILTMRSVVEVDLRALADRADRASDEFVGEDEASDAVFLAHMELVRAEFEATLPRLNETSDEAAEDQIGAPQMQLDLGAGRQKPANGPRGGGERPHRASHRSPAELETSDIQFVVMSSKKLRQKAHLAHRTWCSIAGVRCLFVVDGYFGDGHGNDLSPMFKVPKGRSIDPARCCKGGRGFFCGQHRQETLPAQYRFLPALQHAKYLPHVQSGEVRWVVVVDDDSFVFMANLLKLLRTLNPQDALYFGDVHPGRSIVCGGGGSVFSIGAIRKMDIGRCISAMHRVCMQSDWMLGECAQRAGVTMLKQFGCHTCAAGTRKWYAKVERALPRCYFMQEVDPFLDRLPFNTATPAIIHGIALDRLDDTFHRLMNASVAGT